MTVPAVFKFPNWITGTIVPIDDAITSAFSGTVNTALNTAMLAYINAISTLTNYRPKLSGPLNYFVATTGSDSNDGLTVSTPFLTVQKAINTALAWDFNGFAIIISVADGTYNTTTTANAIFASAPIGIGSTGSLTLQGNTTTPANCILQTTNVSVISITGATNVNIKGFKLISTSGDLFVLNAVGALVKLQTAMEFGGTSGNHINIVGPSQVNMQNIAITISGGGNTFMVYNNNCFIQFNGTNTVTISAAVAITTFIVAQAGGSLVTSGTTTFVNPGNVTGTKYSVISNAILNTNSGGVNFFPGTIAGTTASGGQYL